MPTEGNISPTGARDSKSMSPLQKKKSFGGGSISPLLSDKSTIKL